MIPVGKEAEGGVDSKTTNLRGSLSIDPRGEADKVRLETTGLLHLPRANLIYKSIERTFHKIIMRTLKNIKVVQLSNDSLKLKLKIKNRKIEKIMSWLSLK